jgi:hypothetical protein
MLITYTVGKAALNKPNKLVQNSLYLRIESDLGNTLPRISYISLVQPRKKLRALRSNENEEVTTESRAGMCNLWSMNRILFLGGGGLRTVMVF